METEWNDLERLHPDEGAEKQLSDVILRLLENLVPHKKENPEKAHAPLA